MLTEIDCEPESPLLVVAGPTGSGKSALALQLAKHYNGEIVNCDSVQIYQGFHIGAAKLSIEEQEGIPHHLIDVAGPDHDFTAGDYARVTRPILREITRRGKLPVVCGGTGFYIRALIDGLSPAPMRRPDLRLRLQRIATKRPAVLHRLLHGCDPAAAARIHPNDLQKLIRAIEISRLENENTSSVQSRPRDRLTGYRILRLGLSPERSHLVEVLNRRLEAMFARGLLEETRHLLAGGYKADSKPMQSLGYRQAVQVISGRMGVGEAIKEAQARTRQYAKRQMTWFRSDKAIHWLNGFGSDHSIQVAAFRLAADFLVASSLNIETQQDAG